MIYLAQTWLRPIQTNKNSHREVSIHVGVIVVRIQFFVLIFEFIPIPPNYYIYINYNHPHIFWISNDLIHIELESSSKT